MMPNAVVRFIYNLLKRAFHYNIYKDMKKRPWLFMSMKPLCLWRVRV